MDVTRGSIARVVNERSGCESLGREMGQHVVNDGSDPRVPLSGRKPRVNFAGCRSAPGQFVRGGVDNIDQERAGRIWLEFAARWRTA